MRKVNVTTLKAQLSKYLRLVRSGTELVVIDRNLPIARVSRLTAGGEAKATDFVITPALKDMAKIEDLLPALPATAGKTNSLALLMDDRAR